MKENLIIISDIVSVYFDTLFADRLYIPPLPRRNHVLALVRSGRLSNTSDGVAKVIDTGELLFIRKGTLDVSRIMDCKMVEYISVEFWTSGEDFFLPQKIRLPDTQSLHNAFSEMNHYWNNGKMHGRMKCMAKLYEVLCTILDETDRCSKTGYLYRKIEPAAEYISSHFSEAGLSNGMLANLCDMSEVNLNRIFTKVYGETVHKFILSRRMEKAKALLRGSTYAVSDIAEKCGWQDVYAFSHAFCKRVGMSPTQWRMKL